MNTINGACHCGNIYYQIETEKDLNDLVARACGCSFCRMHGAKSFSDPEGRARLGVKDVSKLERYRFGLRALDFFVCTACGGYAGAVLADDDGTWVTLNLRLSEHRDAPDNAAHYDNQSGAERTARRKKMWTPATIEGL